LGKDLQGLQQEIKTRHKANEKDFLSDGERMFQEAESHKEQ
jgi:hypothetical protein